MINDISSQSLIQESFRTSDMVEEEDVSSSPSSNKPWNPAKIRITTKNFSLREVVDQIREDDIDLSPNFQREYLQMRIGGYFDVRMNG